MIYINLAVGRQYNNFSNGTWYVYSSGIYYTDFLGNYTERADSYDDTFEVLSTLQEVSSVKYDNISLDLQSSVSALETTSGFYFDRIAKRVYIRLPLFYSPDLYDINIGISQYVSDEEYIDANDNVYHPRLISISDITLERDKVTDGDVITFDRFTCKIANGDGLYDDFNQWDIYKQLLSAHTIIEGQDVTLYKGYIWKYTIGHDSINLEVYDQRKGLDNVLNENLYTKAVYPNLADDDVNKPIPIRYGNCRKAQVICVNRASYSEGSAQTLTFHVADTSFHSLTYIDYFYIDNVGKSIASQDVTSGTFTYSKGAGEKVDFDKCTATFRGYKDNSGSFILNGADIVKDLLIVKTGVTFTNTYFDTTRWNMVRALIKSSYLDGIEGTLIDAIQAVLRQNASFIVDANGLYSLTKQDDSKTESYTINKEDILNLQSITENYDVDEIYSSAKIMYSNGLSFVNAANQADIFQKYRTKKQFEYESSLTNIYDVSLFSVELMEVVGNLRPLYSITLPLCKYNDIKLDDVLIIQIDRVASTWRGYVRVIVEGYTYQPQAHLVTLQVRYIGDVTAGAYVYGQTYPYGQAIYGYNAIGGVDYSQ